MTVNMNQFNQQAIAGQLDLQVGGLGPSFTLRIDPDSAGSDIEAGEGLKIVDGGANDPNGVPLCDILAADTEQAFGVRIYDAKQGKAQPGDIVQVTFDGNVVWMEAAAALNRWAQVQLVKATPGQVAAKSTGALFGRLLDKASATGDLVRVLVGTGGV